MGWFKRINFRKLFRDLFGRHDKATRDKNDPVGLPAQPTPPVVNPPVSIPTKPPPVIPGPPPTIRRPVRKIIGKGASEYQAIGDPRIDPGDFAEDLASVGCRHTRVWLIDAWAVGADVPVFLDGQYIQHPATYDGYLPCARAPRDGGRFSLESWRPSYFDRVRTFVDKMNDAGIVPVLTLLELYSWSAGKARLPYVPDRDRSLFRHNVNAVRWGEPDDRTFGAEQYIGQGLPDHWLRSFALELLEVLDGTVWIPEIGNEMPERGMHIRIRDMLRELGYDGPIQVNRNHETPGQYQNMIVEPGFQYLAIHGRESIDYLDRVYPETESSVPTYRRMWETADASRVILSSDGARASLDMTRAYDYDRLAAVFVDALARGAAVEHQLARKLSKYDGGDWRREAFEYDRAFLEAL